MLTDYRYIPWQSPVKAALKNNDNIAFPTESDARYFSQHYKKYFPDYFKSFSKGGNLKPEF